MPYLLKDVSDNCSHFIAKCNLMQCKYIISLNQQFDFSKIGLCWYQRKQTSLSKYTGNYINPTIMRDNEMITYDMIDVDKDNEYIYDKYDNVINEQCHNEEESNNEVCDDRIPYASFMMIYTELFNSLKGC